MSEDARFDVIVVPEDRLARFPREMAVALLRFLHATGVGVPVEEAVARDWLEVYMRPGATPHEPFARDATGLPDPVFVEAVVRAGTDSVSLAYGDGLKACFWLEFRGCPRNELTGGFCGRLLPMFQMRVETFSRPHAGIPPRPEVPEDQRPVETKRASRGSPSIQGVGIQVMDRD